MLTRLAAFAVAGALAFVYAQPQKARGGNADRVVREAPPPIDAAGINSESQADLRSDTKGSGVVRAQILLDRAHYSTGQIDGIFGSNLQKTVAAFQKERQLPATVILDTATWNALNTDKAPVLTTYTITPEDVAGPFVEVPKEMMKKAELPQLGYSSPLDLLAERFHSAPQVLRALNAGVDFAEAGRQITVPNVITLPPGEAATVFVSKAESSVRAYDANGKLLAFYVASTGSEHDPLPVGEWKILGLRRNPEFRYNARLFWDARHGEEKAVIAPGPRNPVGLAWIDLSKDHYGIHGTPDPSLIGHTQSHGCIRLTNWDVLELASMVKPGTRAVLKD